MNTLTQIPYVTYGTEPEVTKLLQEATAAWERKMGPKKFGYAWRDQIKFQATTPKERP